MTAAPIYDEYGRALWTEQSHAMTYAALRHYRFKTRQRCRRVTVGAVSYWHVTKAVGA